MTETFEKTLSWVSDEEKLRKTRGQGISSFYLIIASFMIMGLLIFIVYLVNKHGDLSALDMMRDPENDYYEEGQENDYSVAESEEYE